MANGAEVVGRTERAEASEAAFYAAVATACQAAGIDAIGRAYVEMTCMDNAADTPDVWQGAIDTLRFYIDGNDLQAVARNER